MRERLNLVTGKNLVMLKSKIFKCELYFQWKVKCEKNVSIVESTILYYDAV